MRSARQSVKDLLASISGGDPGILSTDAKFHTYDPAAELSRWLRRLPPPRAGTS